MQTLQVPCGNTHVAALVAGEDIAIGDFVSVLNDVIELPSFLWSCSGSILPPEEPVRIKLMPQRAGTPHKVIAVCLPFVYVKNSKGKLKTLDIRQEQLVRLERTSAKAVWKQLRKQKNAKARKKTSSDK